MFGRILFALVSAVLLLAVQLQAAPPGSPRADYRFGQFNGTTVPNNSGDMPALTMHQSDWVLPGDGTLSINPNSTYTHTIPFDESQGTYLKTETGFSNTFESGTIGIRLKPGPWMDHGGGATWDPGGFIFQRDPLTNDAAPPVELAYYGTPQIPFFFFGPVRSGGTDREYLQGSAIDQFQTQTEFSAIVVWTTTAITLYVDGVQNATKTRDYNDDDPTSNYALWVAVDHSLIHSADRQFFAGFLRRLVIYDTNLNSSDVGLLHTALSEGLDAPGSGHHPRLLHRIFRR